MTRPRGLTEVYSTGYRAELKVDPLLWEEIVRSRGESEWGLAVLQISRDATASGQDSYSEVVEWAEFAGSAAAYDWASAARELHGQWFDKLILNKGDET